MEVLYSGVIAAIVYFLCSFLDLLPPRRAKPLRRIPTPVSASPIQCIGIIRKGGVGGEDETEGRRGEDHVDSRGRGGTSESCADDDAVCNALKEVLGNTAGCGGLGARDLGVLIGNPGRNRCWFKGRAAPPRDGDSSCCVSLCPGAGCCPFP